MSTNRTLSELKGLTCSLNGVVFSFEPKSVNYGTRKRIDSLRFEGINFDKDGKPDNLMKIKENMEKVKEELLRVFFNVPSNINLDECEMSEVDEMLTIVEEADVFNEKKTKTST